MDITGRRGRPTAFLTGVALLLPFWILAVLTWLVPGAAVEPFREALGAYAAVMLGFLGALHWGRALAEVPAEGDLVGRQGRQRLAWGALLALLGWGCLMLPWAGLALSLLFLALLSALWMERRLEPGPMPGRRSDRALRWFIAAAALALLGGIASWSRAWLPGGGA
jgi:hypothetical protein